LGDSIATQTCSNAFVFIAVLFAVQYLSHLKDTIQLACWCALNKGGVHRTRSVQNFSEHTTKHSTREGITNRSRIAQQ
jgi:hypothetical protein